MAEREKEDGAELESETAAGPSVRGPSKRTRTHNSHMIIQAGKFPPSSAPLLPLNLYSSL